MMCHITVITLHTRRALFDAALKAAHGDADDGQDMYDSAIRYLNRMNDDEVYWVLYGTLAWSYKEILEEATR